MWVMRSAPNTARISVPAPRRMMHRMFRVSFAFLRGSAGFFSLAGFFAAFAFFGFFLRLLSSVGSGFGYWNTGKVMPSAPAFTVRVSCSQLTSAQNGMSSNSTIRASTTSSRMPRTFSRNSSTPPTAARTVVMGHPSLSAGASG